MGNRSIKLYRSNFRDGLTFRKGFDKFVNALKKYGPLTTFIKGTSWLSNTILGRQGIISPSDIALETDVVHPPKLSYKEKVDLSSLTVNWVVPTIGLGGGFINIFRFIKHFNEAGHKVRIYEQPVSQFERSSKKEVDKVIEQFFGGLSADVRTKWDKIEPADITFATSWHTAYVVFPVKNTLQKFYFIQDFEADFVPKGSQYALIENTYKMPFYGITAGKWLSEKLSSEYKLNCEYYDLAVDSSIYFRKNFAQNKEEKRTKVFFYARPVTERRGFEIGFKALEEFQKKNPQFEIVLAGWNLGKLPDGFKSLGQVKDERKLNDLYNECAVGLVLSFTNCSLLPLELMAAGCPVVTNVGLNNELNLPKRGVFYAEQSPFHIAQVMEKVVNSRVDSKELSTIANNYKWEDQLKKVDNIINSVLTEKLEKFN
jgi:glycosyltransferase involved in cell wall biosynthesis